MCRTLVLTSLILLGLPLQATAQRFEFAANGAVVIDNQTGLQWMRCSMGQQWDAGSGGCTGQAASYSWQKATQLSSNVGGYDDWRLPGKDALNTLVICSSGQRDGFETEGIFAGNGGRCQGGHDKPAIDQAAFPDTPHREAFWTADKLENAPVRHAWVVGFGTGYVNDIARGKPEPHVRLVRE